ncbi:hypothetical protein F5Y09DRAFT_309101 [Xylaria sp. FL1042]|nr:hypothetical protein F5Y09DRAFT_309101 [Xylaria sp. FL1042]
MLRQLRSTLRSFTSTGSFIGSSQPQPSLAWQRHFFSRSGIPRHGPRTNQYRQYGSRPRQLSAGVQCTIWTSLASLALSEDIDWEEFRFQTLAIIHSITREEDEGERWRKLCAVSGSALASFSETELEHFGRHTAPIQVPYDVVTGIMTAPDPEVEGGTLVVCIGMVVRTKEGLYLTEHGDRLTDLSQDIMPKIEAFARNLEGSPKVRGCLVLLDQDGGWKSLYWDGRRWINIIFVECQTAESMAPLFV